MQGRIRGAWRPRPPGVTKGEPKERRKRKGKTREKIKKKRKRKRKPKEGTNKRKDRKVNQYNERGSFRGGLVDAGGAPSYFFAEIGRLTLCGRLSLKECTKSCELTLKI